MSIFVAIDQSHPQEDVRNHQQGDKRQRLETSGQQIVRIIFVKFNKKRR